MLPLEAILIVMENDGVIIWLEVGKVYAWCSRTLPLEASAILDLDLRLSSPLIYGGFEEIIDLNGGIELG